MGHRGVQRKELQQVPGHWGEGRAWGLAQRGPLCVVGERAEVGPCAPWLAW